MVFWATNSAKLYYWFKLIEDSQKKEKKEKVN